MLTACPRCEYPLTGLPADHACPECGLKYDSASRIYFPAIGSDLFRRGAHSMMAVFFAVQVMRAVDVSPPKVKPFIYYGSLLLLTTIAWFVWRNSRPSNRRRFLAILPEMLLVPGPLQIDEIPWSNISRVTANHTFRAINVFVRDKRIVRSVGGFFSSRAEAHDAASHAMSRIRGEKPLVGGHDVKHDDASEAAAPDENAQCFRLKDFREPRPFGYLVPVLAAMLIAVFGLPVAIGPKLILLASLVTLTAAVEIFVSRRAPRVSQSVELNRNGITMKRGDHTSLRFSWQEVTSASTSPFGGVFRIHGLGGFQVFECPAEKLGPKKVVRKIVNEIIRLKAFYAHGTGDSATHPEIAESGPST